MSVSLDTPEDIANWLRRHFVGQTFGCVRFWQFALVRPNDQFFQLASVTGWTCSCVMPMARVRPGWCQCGNPWA